MFINQILTKLKSLVYSKSETDSLLNGKASSSHTHTKSQITDFPTIPSKVSQLTNDSGFLTSHQSLANYVTLNSDQTIPGYKIFSGLTKTSGKVGYDTSGNDVNNAIYNMETTAWGPETANKPESNYGTLLSLNREVNVHTSAGVGWIVQFGIGTDTRLYLRTKTNIGGAWSSWKEFSDISHTHTKSQITDFPTIPTDTNQLTNGAGFITSSGSCNYANSSGNADTVDGSHAWQMQTLASTGNTHGSNDWLMQCQYNVDGDGYFKLYCGDKSIGTKVDRASSAGYADSAGNSGYTNWLRTSSHSDHLFHTEWDGSYFWTYVTAGDGGYRAVRVERSNSAGWADSAGGVAWDNVSGRPWALSQFTNDSGFITSEIDSSGTGWVRFKCGVQICYGEVSNNNNLATGIMRVNFPAPFNAKPNVVATPNISAQYIVTALVESQYTWVLNTFGAYGGSVNYVVDTLSANYVAIGTWR